MINESNVSDQWDGTDIEPSFPPRKVKSNNAKRSGTRHDGNCQEGDNEPRSHH